MASLGTKISTTPAFPPPPVIDWALAKRTAPAATHSFTRRQWLFVVADLCCVISGASLAILWRFASPAHRIAPSITLADHLSITVLYAVLIALLCYTQSLYSIYQPISRLQKFSAIAKSVLMATFRRWSLGKAIADGLSCQNVLIIGAGPITLSLARHLTIHRQLGFVVPGHLADPARILVSPHAVV